MTLMPRWLKDLLKRSAALVNLYVTLMWKLHLLKDWWGTRVWTRTSEVKTPLGFKLTSGFHPAYELMRRGEFEVEETAILSQLLPKADRFLDIGANLGYYSCLALQQGIPVLAFEPQQQNLQCLFRNLTSNGWQDTVEVFPLALSDRPGLMTLYGASGPSASLVKNWAGYSPHYRKLVATNTLDNILTGRFANQRLLIKIDVEGAEHQVLKGAHSTLARSVKPVWLLEVCMQEFHPEGTNPNFREIFDLFFFNGYAAYTVAKDPQPVTISDIDAWLRDNRTALGTFNYIFAGPEEPIVLK